MEMGGCTQLLARFVLRLGTERLLPLPGDVFCLVAGPPCQHLTGLNHKANSIKVMKDAVNRIVLSVLRIVEHLRPPFVLLEQVRALWALVGVCFFHRGMHVCLMP